MSFKKYKLYSDDDIDRLRQKYISEYNPNLSSLSKIQSDIESILESNSDVPVEDKLKLLSSLQDRFHSLKSSITKPEIQSKKSETLAIQQLATDKKANADAVEEEDQDDEEKNPIDILDILHSFDPSYHFRIRTLLSSISKNPDIISFDVSNQLIIDGVVLKGTNIVNCLKRFFNIKIPGTHVLRGHKSFLSA